MRSSRTDPTTTSPRLLIKWPPRRGGAGSPSESGEQQQGPRFHSGQLETSARAPVPARVQKRQRCQGCRDRTPRARDRLPSSRSTQPAWHSPSRARARANSARLTMTPHKYRLGIVRPTRLPRSGRRESEAETSRAPSAGCLRCPTSRQRSWPRSSMRAWRHSGARELTNWAPEGAPRGRVRPRQAKHVCSRTRRPSHLLLSPTRVFR